MKQHSPSEERIDILVVDDRRENLLAMQTALESLGHNLVVAGSGREALEHVLRNNDFAVIVLDIQMPEMDGFETAALIRRREKSQQIPIIFLTAFGTSTAEVFRGYSVGAVDYLIKPFMPEVLKAKVGVFVDLFRVRKQLERMNETLEQRVAERTEALQKAEKERAELLDRERIARQRAEEANR